MNLIKNGVLVNFLNNIRDFFIALILFIFPLNRTKHLKIKSVKLFDPYILIINFTYKDDPYFIILEGEYPDLYKKVGKEEALEVIDAPLADIVAGSWRHWRYKKRLYENNN